MGMNSWGYHLHLLVINKRMNLRRISCPGSWTSTRSPAGSGEGSRRLQPCGAAGGCSWLLVLVVDAEMLRFPRGLSQLKSADYRKSMRAPVAVACNRIISAESDSGLEGGGGRGWIFRLTLAREEPKLLRLLVIYLSWSPVLPMKTDIWSTFIRKLSQLQRLCVHPTWKRGGVNHFKTGRRGDP